MRALQRTGGAAAHVAAGTFVVGLLLFVTALSDFASASSAAQAIASLEADHGLIDLWILVTTIMFGIALVPLTIALRERAGSGSGSSLARVASVFGQIWAGVIIAAGMVWMVGYRAVADLVPVGPDSAAQLWRAVDAVGDGLGGGNEVVGAVWVVLVSLSTWHARALPRWICVLGIIAGAAGIATLVPGASDAGAIFGLGMIVWFTAVGTVLTSAREPRPAPAEEPAATAHP